MWCRCRPCRRRAPTASAIRRRRRAPTRWSPAADGLPETVVARRRQDRAERPAAGADRAAGPQAVCHRLRQHARSLATSRRRWWPTCQTKPATSLRYAFFTPANDGQKGQQKDEFCLPDANGVCRWEQYGESVLWPSIVPLVLAALAFPLCCCGFWVAWGCCMSGSEPAEDNCCPQHYFDDTGNYYPVEPGQAGDDDADSSCRPSVRDHHDTGARRHGGRAVERDAGDGDV
jgi:hypothetical protein